MNDETNQNAPTGLTIQDLTLTLQIVQVATSRGAFKADELTAVGGLYDRIFKFLESTGVITTLTPEQAAAKEAEAAAAAAEATTQVEEVAAPETAKPKKARVR